MAAAFRPASTHPTLQAAGGAPSSERVEGKSIAPPAGVIDLKHESVSKFYQISLYSQFRGCDFPFVARWIDRPAGAFSGLNDGLARLISLVFPDDCALCGNPLTRISRYPVCEPCLAAVEPLVAEYYCRQCRTPYLNEFPLRPDGVCALCRLGLTQFSGAWSYGSFEGRLAELIHLFKYQKVQTLDRPLGALLVKGLPPELRIDVAVPVPLHWSKKLARGFNQSELLARELCRRTGLAFADALRRTRSTTAQAGLTAAARRRNVAGVFAARDPAAVAGKRVLLIDDVMTTGATLSAASAALKRAGALRVSVLTLARTDRRIAANRPAQVSPSFLAASGVM